MSPENEIMLSSIDGWHAEFAFENIYEPMDKQGIISLCWYNGEDALSGERYGQGYPGGNGYHTAFQIVFLAGTTNPDGKYVFGNSDMRICLPDEKYQHFYEGLPSTNGLSGKWIAEIAIYSGEVPAKAIETFAAEASGEGSSGSFVIPLIIGVVGLVIIGGSTFIILRRKSS
jgi:hypothetical protein